MKGGVLGVAANGVGRLQSFTETQSREGRELTTRVEVTGVRQTPDGVQLTEGRAARERLRTQESVKLNGNGITVTEESTVTTDYTEFFVVDDDLVVVQNGAGKFLFDVLNHRYGTPVERATIDLDVLLGRFDDAIPWKVGFRGHNDVADNGVIHGESVLSDELFGEALRTAEKNQLGLEFSENGSTMKIVATASGYVEVYQPSDFTKDDFSGFLKADILPVLGG